MSKKRNFLDSYAKEFPGVIKRTKNDDEFHCIPCNDDFSLATAGKGAITQHIAKSKHKQNERAMNTSKEFLECTDWSANFSVSQFQMRLSSESSHSLLPNGRMFETC